MLGMRTFDPTGTRVQKARAEVVFPLWEALCMIILVAGGIASANWILLAMGLAIGSAPLLRSRLEVILLAVGPAVFWTLIAIQIGIDVASGTLPATHIIALVGLPLLQT